MNVASWWLALQAAVELLVRIWSPDPVTAGVVAKVLAFGAAAFLITWKWPPRVQGVTAAWWVRVAVVVALWFLVLERIGGVVATAWRQGTVDFTPIGSTMIFTVVVAVITGLIAPRDAPADEPSS